jgi:ABC-type lipoprotein release transport system permease subunit
MALEPGRGRTAVPVRTTMFGASLSILALVAALVFGASLDRLLSTPRLAGYSWDVLMFPSARGSSARAQEAKLESIFNRSPKVSGYAFGVVDNVDIGPLHLVALAMEPRKGDVVPAIGEGRQPQGTDEIALGTATMQKLGVGIGQTVSVSRGRQQLDMRVVGRVSVPPLFFTFGGPGQGAAISLAASHRLHPDRPNIGGFFVRLAPGANQDALHREIRKQVGNVFWLPRQVTPQVHNLNGVGNVPIILAGIVAVMAAATLAHTLITSIRRRRLDLAILKTLGFVRGQISATVAWQATTLAIVALAIGIPLGIMAGRWGWNYFAERLGVVPSVALSVGAILLAVPVTIVVANLLAVVPGRIASRLKAAPVLRSE